MVKREMNGETQKVIRNLAALDNLYNIDVQHKARLYLDPSLLERGCVKGLGILGKLGLKSRK